MGTTPRTKISRTQRSRSEGWTRKNIMVHQEKLDRAKAIFRVETETAAIDAALDLAQFQEEVLSGIDRLAKAGGLADPFKRH